LRHRSYTPSTTFASGARTLVLVALAFGVLFSAWAGCSANGNESSAALGSGGSGGKSTGTKMTTSSTGGPGGGGGTAAGGGDGGQCSATEKMCNGTCVSVTDPMYGCGPSSCTACVPANSNATATCVMMNGAETCNITCVPGYSDCDGNPGNGCETDTGTDPQNCGACGAPCSVPHATPACVMGKCEVGTCDSGWVDCDMIPTNGCESNPNSDNNNCGTCGVVCPNPLQCGLVSNDMDGGTLTDNDGGVPLNDAGVPIATCNLYCEKGKTNCDGNPLDGCNVPLGTDTNCTMCGDTCDLANAMSGCQPNNMPPPAPAYVCDLGPCNPGFANCDMVAANGCEVNTMTDASNCGSCGNACPFGPNSTAVCINGGCALNCFPGYANCDNNPTNGCEVDTTTDVNNCGTGQAACGAKCITPNATPVCAPSMPGGTTGICEIQMCNAGFMDCDMNPVNGCEINIETNPSDCGGCGTVCTIANGVAGCANGMCTVGSCNMGWTDCDGLVSDGCETHTGVDVNNCGTCNNKCNLANATPTCTGGVCEIAACNQGYQDCDHQPNDGCEVNTQGDPLNCGACNKQCFVSEGTAGCSMGNCTVASCNPGWADCNMSAQDGCETPITTVANCGSCGNNCISDCQGNVTATQCTAGACEVLACAAGSYDIDGLCADGCECTTKGTSSSCNAPSSLGSLTPGQTITYTGNLVPLGQEAYLSITFTGNAGSTYHPSVTLTTGAGEFEFDIEANCTPTLLGCGVEGGSSSGRTAWEVFYNPEGMNAPEPNPNDSTPPFIPIPEVGTNGTVIIHVYRRAGQKVSCDPYTLTIGN
jgi:hypothetical protein